MSWSPLDTWIVVIGILAAVSCSLVGTFLVLRRMSMMGDAISHAVLPGLAAAFLLTQSRDSLPMFLGAVVVGVLTALLVQWLHQLGRVEQSASMGVVFTTLFAIGLILLVRGADSVDLDPSCVLYGAIELAPLNTVRLLGLDVPRAAVSLAVVLLVNLAFVVALYKELKITTFDGALATTMGINANAMHYLLMALVAVTAVASFEAVGSILVIAMLIVPAAAAHLLTERLWTMLVFGALIAAASAPLGHAAAIVVPGWFGYEDTNTAGAMAVVAGIVFGVVLLIAPRHGIVSKAVQRWRLSVRIAGEDMLGMLYRFEEIGTAGDEGPRPAEILAALGVGPATRLLARTALARRGRIRRRNGRWVLTDSGRRAAREIVRSHRLWETYLHARARSAPDQVHGPAHRLEHVTDGAMRARLAAATHPDHPDPHGSPIPPESDEKAGI